MKEIVKDLFLIDKIGSANVFLIKNKNTFSLIDTGIFMKTKYLINEIINIGFKLSNLQMIILTHCHCDHIGGVKELLDQSNAKVAAHIDDISYIIQKKVIDGPYHNMMIEEQKVMKKFNCIVKKVDISLKDGDVLDLMGGLEVINVPGHTPGSIALYQKDKKIMFFGDVIRNNEKHGLVIGIPENFNYNTLQLKADAKKLLSYPIDFAIFSHGIPILKENINKLEILKN
jgi:glyoxylase-like metal-dependent hydrolase (beta-lactamase superfamily II)